MNHFGGNVFDIMLKQYSRENGNSIGKRNLGSKATLIFKSDQLNYPHANTFEGYQHFRKIAGLEYYV